MSSEPKESHSSSSQAPVMAAVVLAAGESSRMGADKALLMYRGRTFLENIISVLRDAGITNIVVVLGHHAELIQQRVDLSSVEVVVNQDYRRGQTSSLQAGLRVLAPDEPDGVVLCLVDHPVISADPVQKLIQRFRLSGKPVVIPQLNGKHGHPVLLGREVLSQIAALGAEQGADIVIHRYRPQTEFIEVTDPGILIDVDDP
ncbi:MAG TPA: nucleotidyltransferase family protein, partial [Terriglobia bacterium]|nr:nucleotidyltransferase family protein [Terriglobia bacterium]